MLNHISQCTSYKQSIFLYPVKKIGKPSSTVNKNITVLDMTAILKDLNQVKLKAVER